MSELRLWVHERFARLDGRRERRFVALAASLIFAVLALGPQALRAVDSTLNAPDIRIDELGTEPVRNPVRFKATSLNVTLRQLEFIVSTGTESMTMPARQSSAADPSLWESEDFNGAPGATYIVKARGFSTDAATAVESSREISFVVFDPNATTNTGETEGPSTEQVPQDVANALAEIIQLAAWPGTAPSIEAKGRHSGFAPDTAFFRVRSLTGLAFLGEYAASRVATDAWHATFAVPGGEKYAVTFVAKNSSLSVESFPQEVAVPAPETVQPPAAQEPTAAAPAPTPAPSVTMLLPSSGASTASPVPFAARVSNATATRVIFDVVDPAGVTRGIDAVAGGSGDWTAMFLGGAGQYKVGVRAFTTNGEFASPEGPRSFSIIASATETETAPAQEQTAPAAPVIAPTVELFSPPDGSDPFPGPVQISARVKDGLPEKVVAVVAGPSGEIIVIASKTPSGDFWTALFEGPDGDYRFRVRALVAGKDIFSVERRFSVRRPITSLPPPPPKEEPAAPTTAIAEPTTRTIASEPSSSVTTDGATGTPTSPIASAIPPELADECRSAGIPPERCAEWLKVKYQSRECLDAGALTRESCSELLARLRLSVDESKLFGMASSDEIQEARDVARQFAGRAMAPEEMPSALGRLLAFKPRPEERWRALPSSSGSPALLVLDTDGDGLPDDFERRLGTDPNAADTDGDGFSDGTEVRSGYDPLGPGQLTRAARGIEKAMLDERDLEEPRGAETLTDAGFSITAEDAGEDSAGDAGSIRLSGKASPNTVVAIFVYSYLPIVVTTTTDENGEWTYEFSSELSEGRHEAYVSVNDDTGKLVAASSPLSFFVKEAQAVSEEDFLRPDVNVEETPASLSRWFIIGGAALVMLAIVLVAAIVRQARKEPITGTDAGV